MKRIFNIACILALSVLTACQDQSLDICCLSINAQIGPEALEQLEARESGYTEDGMHQTIRFVLYDNETHEARYMGSFRGLQGEVEVEQGTYDVLLYTSDFNELDANFYKGLQDPLTAETYTRQTPVEQQSSIPGVEEVRMREPDPTFSAFVQDVIVLGDNEENVLDVELEQKSYRYTILIEVVRGLMYVHSATLDISGLYTSAYLLKDEHKKSVSGIQTVEMDVRFGDPRIGNGTFYAEFWSFGPNTRDDVQHTLTLTLMGSDEICVRLKDQTKQIKGLTRGGEIIIDEKLEIVGPQQ